MGSDSLGLSLLPFTVISLISLGLVSVLYFELCTHYYLNSPVMALEVCIVAFQEDRSLFIQSKGVIWQMRLYRVAYNHSRTGAVLLDN